jgi:magnesium transporter
LVGDLQLRHRDIRALEPGVALPYPSAIFVRKHAVVINMEGLKVIISRDKTLVISVPHANDLAIRTPPDLNNPTVVRLTSHIAMRSWPFGEGEGMAQHADEMKMLSELPHELRALEASLLVMVKVLASEVKILEDRLSPVLVRLRARVGRVDLEAVYDIQNRLDKTVARVGKIKELLEELLDDEQALLGMCLARSARLEQEEAEEDERRAAIALAAMDGDGGGNNNGDANNGGDHSKGNTKKKDGGKDVAESDDESITEDEEVSELEDMIEAYWLQVDSLLSRLTILQERITNTEHLVNLDLDSKRNALVALSLFIDILLMGFEIHMTVTGIFGQNMVNGLERWEPYSVWGVAGVGIVLATTMVGVVAHYARRKGLLFLPSFGLGGGQIREV